MLILLLCAAAPLLAQEESGPRVVVVEHADSLVGRTIAGEAVRELIGNVRLRQASVVVTCDRALQRLASGIAELTGNVVVQDDSVVLRAPRGVYHRDARRAEAFDGVTLEDGHVRVEARTGRYDVERRIAGFRTDVSVRDSVSVLTADTLTYFREERRSVAERGVVIEDLRDAVRIAGEWFENSAPRRYSRMTGMPLLVQFDTAATGRIETLVVRSRLMESFRDSIRRLVATDSVTIARGPLAAAGGRAVFHMDGDSMHLRQAPVVWYRTAQLTGDSITVYLRERVLHRVLVAGDAFALSWNDSGPAGRYDQMTGERMELAFEDQELHAIAVDVQAVSLYHLYEDTLANGLNRTSGDRILVDFRDRRVDAIRVYGGTEGAYVPENLVRGREREYALAGFRLLADRPRAQAEDFRRFRTEGGRR
jgi:lipopolysaccharide export system protein LptA